MDTVTLGARRRRHAEMGGPVHVMRAGGYALCGPYIARYLDFRQWDGTADEVTCPKCKTGKPRAWKS